MSSFSFEPHPSDDVLELYSLNQLAGENVAVVEEHLLICTGCQERLAKVESFVSAMKDVCLETVRSTKVERPSFLRVQLPKALWTAVFALTVLGISDAFIDSRSTGGAETEINLVASRGMETRTRTPGPVRLNVETSQLPRFSHYRLALVDATGHDVWQTDVQPQGSNLSVRVPLRLDAAKYWVRISGPTGAPIREFALTLL